MLIIRFAGLALAVSADVGRKSARIAAEDAFTDSLSDGVS